MTRMIRRVLFLLLLIAVAGVASDLFLPASRPALHVALKHVGLGTAADRLAIRAARAVGARVAGVDLLPDPDRGLVVLEVNAVPGWRALAAASGVDVAAAILADLRDAGRG